MNFNWKKSYFDETLCKGFITNLEDGNIKIEGTLKNGLRNVNLTYWGASPSHEIYSFCGSGLPFHSHEQAFYNKTNMGQVQTDGSKFTINMKYPNSYYVGLGSYLVPPEVYLKVCGSDDSEIITLNVGPPVPFRTLTYPLDKNRHYPKFYNNSDLPIRSQEQIIRDGQYPRYVVIPPKMPDNFWGLRPAL